MKEGKTNIKREMKAEQGLMMGESPMREIERKGEEKEKESEVLNGFITVSSSYFHF